MAFILDIVRNLTFSAIILYLTAFFPRFATYLIIVHFLLWAMRWHLKIHKLSHIATERFNVRGLRPR